MKNIIVRYHWFSARIYDADRLPHLCRQTIAPTNYHALPTKRQLDSAVRQYATTHGYTIVKTINERS